MKKLIVLLSIILSMTSLFAEEKKIELNKKISVKKEYRSGFSELIATQDDSTLRLYTDKFTNKCRITVTDGMGQTIYTETVSIIPESPHVFTLDNAEKGMYQLNIETDEATYYGIFEIL